MRWLKNAGMSILILFLMAISGSQAVSAAEEAYTYTVRLYAGNQGTITNSGVEISSSTARISFSDDCAVISGLQYGDMVYIRPQDAIETTDERYYVRGVRRSGRDNAQAESPAFYVACDRDFVAAYGVRGDMAEYTVSYQDEAGNTLMKSDTYYGNIGERQYVSSRYIEGYQPSSLNMVKTLSANAAENIFTFRYTRIAAGTTPAPGGTTTTATTGTTTAGTTTTQQVAGRRGHRMPMPARQTHRMPMRRSKAGKLLREEMRTCRFRTIMFRWISRSWKTWMTAKFRWQT